MHPREKHCWHVLGAGAIGSLWAAWLDERCTLITRNKLPFDILHLNKSTQTHSINIKSIPATELDEPIAFLLVCTKAHQTLSAIQQIPLQAKPTIVLLQNGLGVYEAIKPLYPDARIFSATTTHGAYKENIQTVVHAGEGNTWLGSLDAQINRQEIQSIADDLSNNLEQPVADDNIEARLWKKLAINCAINPLTVIYQCKNGMLLQNPAYYQHMETLCTELDKVLRVKNLLTANKSILETVSKVAEQTANNFSSMLQDNQHKRKSEIDFIQGYLCQQANSLGIDTPENRKLLAHIKKIESTY